MRNRDRYVVRYSVAGFDKEFAAGPYTEMHQALAKRHEIESYEGVVNVRIEPLPKEVKS